MRSEWRLITGAAVFLGLIAGIYWFTSYEDAGTALLVFGFAAYLMLGGFLALQWLKRQKNPRPEDKYDGSHDEGAGEIGFFPHASIWPAGMGLGVVITSFAFIYGNWYWVMGLPILFGAIIGFTVEAEAPEDPIEVVPSPGGELSGARSQPD